VGMTWEEALAHKGGEDYVPKAVREAVARLLPGHLWIEDNLQRLDFDGWDDGYEGPAMRRVRCDRCGEHWIEERRGRRWGRMYWQGMDEQCPQCGEHVTVKHLSRGFSGLVDRLNVIWYQPSVLRPGALVACAARVTRDYGEADPTEPWTQEPEFELRSLAVILPGVGVRKFRRIVDLWEPWVGPISFRWEAVAKVSPLTFGSSYGRSSVECVLLTDTLTESLEYTPFARAWDDDYLLNESGQDGVEALDLIARYPCVEYMTKLGLQRLVTARLRHELPSGLVNWRGTRLEKVLRLSRERWGRLKAAGLSVTPELLAVLQYADGRGLRCSEATAAGVAALCRRQPALIPGRLEKALALFQPSRRSKALRWLGRLSGQGLFELGDAADYWTASAELGASLDDDAVAFPADFRVMHDRAMARRKAQGSVQANAAIARQAKKWARKFGFTFGGLVLRPAADAAEVIREGEVLGHCVARYVDRYAAGKTVICVLRRAVQPDAPWRTVEITPDGRVVQDRGYRNDWSGDHMFTEAYQAMLKCFWEAWRERRRPTEERRGTNEEAVA